MIKTKDFNKAVNFIYKKAEERGIEIVQIDSSAGLFSFYGKSLECGTLIYAEINTVTGAILLGVLWLKRIQFLEFAPMGL